MEITTEMIEEIDNDGKDVQDEPEKVPVEYFLNKEGERYFISDKGEKIKTTKLPEVKDILHNGNKEYFFSPSGQWVEKTKKAS